MSEQAPTNLNYNPNDLHAVISAINTKIDALSLKMDNMEKKLDANSERLTVLENFRYLLMGGAMVVSGIISYLAQKFWGHS